MLYFIALAYVPCQFLMPLTMPEGEAAEAASLEHDWQLDSLTRAYLHTSVVGADESPILYQDLYDGNLVNK